MSKNDGKSFAVELVQMPWCPGRVLLVAARYLNPGAKPLTQPRRQGIIPTSRHDPGAKVSFQPPDMTPVPGYHSNLRNQATDVSLMTKVVQYAIYLQKIELLFLQKHTISITPQLLNCNQHVNYES
jgi:hypothetical protein